MKLKSKLEELKGVDVKVIRVEKCGNKIIIVLESDLFSDQTFVVNFFYDEGDKKNQLQEVYFEINLSEKSGKIKCGACYANSRSHFTKGHTQLHNPMSHYFIDKKDLAIDEILRENENYIYDERYDKLISLWESEPEFQEHLKRLIQNRKDELKQDKIKKARGKFEEAYSDLNEAIKHETNN